MNVGGHTCRNQLIRTLSSTEPERITVGGEVEDLESKGTASYRTITSSGPCTLTPGSPLYALNFCERRPSGTRLSATSEASRNLSAVRVLSLRLSDDLSGASGGVNQRIILRWKPEVVHVPDVFVSPGGFLNIK
jgi:hypothetical protein